MRWHDVEQNTDEWLDLRVGKLTGSSVSVVMANYGKAFGDPACRLAVSLAREQVTGRRSVAESFSNAHTERGHAQEPIARMLYQEQTFTDVLNGGFFERDNLGCSPDGLVMSDGLVEIKSVVDHVHYSNIRRGGIDPKYKWQIYFNLMVTERDWIDFVSYCADFPPDTQLYTFRVSRGECGEFFDMMSGRIADFFEMVEQAKAVITGEAA